jgi:lipoprotein-anchoring transpeptidase ErfK/SrfK
VALPPAGVTYPGPVTSTRPRIVRRGHLGIVLLAVLGFVLAACSSSSKGTGTGPSSSASSASSSSASSSSAAPSSSKPAGPTQPVHLALLQGDGVTYGVGEPIIVRFSVKPTNAKPFVQAAKVTVNGQPAHGGWYFERPYADVPMEAHFRLQDYWPAHSRIHLDLPMKGVSAGTGLAYSDSLTLDMLIGDQHISTIDGGALTMTVRDNGVVVKTMKVSLGAAKTPTYNGIKVVMEKENPQRMIGDGLTPSSTYNELVPWSVRVTRSGEFIHAAAWNTGNIGNRSTSNGCTNLLVTDAQWFYTFSVYGDVTVYQNATGGQMPPLDGLGDWNIAWSQWQAGGVLATS